MQDDEAQYQNLSLTKLCKAVSNSLCDKQYVRCPDHAWEGRMLAALIEEMAWLTREDQIALDQFTFTQFYLYGFKCSRILDRVMEDHPELSYHQGNIYDSYYRETARSLLPRPPRATDQLERGLAIAYQKVMESLKHHQREAFETKLGAFLSGFNTVWALYNILHPR